MKVAITGASGLIGSYLCSRYIGKGNDVIALTRSKRNFPNIKGLKSIIEYGYTNNTLDKSINGTDLFINLTGKNIVGRWTKTNKQIIYKSRVEYTQNLVDSLSKLSNPPKMLISASAIGYYGDTGIIKVNEQSDIGSGFFSELCKDWEQAALKAETFDIKTVTLRIGIVISNKGGAFSRMLLPFKLGLGAKFGSGKQLWSWVHIEDVYRAIEFARENNIVGPINIVAPEVVTQYDFAKHLANVLSRPLIFTLPEILINPILGEMSTELLSSKNVVSQKLNAHGFRFRYENITQAFAAELNGNNQYS